VSTTALHLAIAAGVAVAYASAAAASTPERIVPCGEVIGSTTFPYVGNPNYRLVLDAVSVPPAFMAQVVPTHERPWSYWRKQGLVVRGNGDTVTITVPAGWRDKVAVAWGYGGKGGPFSSLRIAACGSDPSKGDAYSGGFNLRSRSACVPLLFRVGQRSQTVRFGLGKRCGNR
jgi:hypothetical protein